MRSHPACIRARQPARKSAAFIEALGAASRNPRGGGDRIPSSEFHYDRAAVHTKRESATPVRHRRATHPIKHAPPVPPRDDQVVPAEDVQVMTDRRLRQPHHPRQILHHVLHPIRQQ
jgi:hypothetical protein